MSESAAVIEAVREVTAYLHACGTERDNVIATAGPRAARYAKPRLRADHLRAILHALADKHGRVEEREDHGTIDALTALAADLAYLRALTDPEGRHNVLPRFAVRLTTSQRSGFSLGAVTEQIRDAVRMRDRFVLSTIEPRITALLTEHDRLNLLVGKLTDRVIAAEDHQYDAAELARENTELRRQLADTPSTEAAIGKLREWIPDYEAGDTHVAMPTATARKLLAAIETEGGGQ